LAAMPFEKTEIQNKIGEQNLYIKKDKITMTFYRLIFTGLFVQFFTCVSAQDKTEGKVTFNIEYDAAFASGLPKEEIVLFSPEVTRGIAEIPKGIVVDGTNYIFFKDSSKFFNLYVMGREINGNKKFAILENRVNLKLGKPKESNKKILGYNCKEMTAETVDGKKKYKFYYTEELNASYFPVGLSATLMNVFVLQYEIQTSLMTKKAKAVNIDFLKLEENDKIIPSEYKIATREQFRQLSGSSVIKE
jgi:hypothetical protein